MKKATKYMLIVILLNFSNCAERKMEPFIVGGEFASITKYPHSAFLDARCDTEGNWICGSSILNQRILLTAAHCVLGCQWKTSKTNKLIAFVGNSNLNKVTIKREIIDVCVHSNFHHKTMENDIALAVVGRDFPLGLNVKRVVITRRFPDDAYTSYTYVAGWGLVNDEKETSSIHLKYVPQKIRTMKTCALIGRLHQGMFCSGSTEKTPDHPARGDSGSALVTASGYHQVGLLSFYIKKFPSLVVYINVSYYHEWILMNAKLLYCAN